MAITGVEHLVATGPNPYGYVVGDYLVSVGGLDDAWSILHIPTLSARMYATIFDVIRGSARNNGVVLGGRIWFEGTDYWGGYKRGYLISIDPALGSPTRHTTANTMIGTYVLDGTAIIGRRRYETTTGVLSDIYGTYQTWTSVGIAGGSLYRVNGTSGVKLDPATGALQATFTLPATVGSYQQAILIGTKLHWPTGSGISVGIDTATGATFLMLATPAGFSNSGNRWTLASDGYLYRLQPSTSNLQVADPATGRWAQEPLPTSRTERHVVAWGGKILIPSGQPRPW